MKVAFLQETLNQNIGIMYVSSMLKSKSHLCRLFIEHLEKDFINAVSAYHPDIIGLSVITGAHHWVLAIASCLKKILPDALIILGGPHPTYFPEIVSQPFIDAVFRGEAELSILDFVNRLERGQDYTDVSGVWVKKNEEIYRNDLAPLVEDISSLPFPDHELYLRYKFFLEQSEIPFNASRGCPYGCTFCYNRTKAKLYAGKGKYVRTRTAEELIGEIEFARSIYPNMRSIVFSNDHIGADKQWLVHFCQAYAKRVGIPWFTSIRADVIDESVVRELAKSNCYCLTIGVETGDELLREKILGKNIPNSQYIKAARLLRSSGIKIRTSSMLFLPHETIETVFKTIDLNREMKVNFAWGYTLQPYPGTEIYDYAIKNGYLSSSFNFDDIDPLGLLKPILKVKDERKILAAHRLFPLAVKYSFLRKTIKFLIVFGPNPLYDMVYALALILSFADYHQVSFWRAFVVAWNNYWSTRKTRSRISFRKRRERCF
jgi:anaerobic magnesium-protoporphyrin IX monomethyl ester cyclase